MSVPDLDWEQPQFFFRFSEGTSRAREQSRETQEEKAALGQFRFLRVLLDGPGKKKRLPVVPYPWPCYAYSHMVTRYMRLSDFCFPRNYDLRSSHAG